MSSATSEYVSSEAAYPVRRSKNTAGEGIQHVRLDVGSGTTESVVSGSIPTSSAGWTAQTATQTNSTVSTAKTIAVANASRKGGYIQAAWANTDNIYLSFNSPATSSDIPIAPGGVFNMTLNYGGPPITNAIYGIAGSGTQSYCVVEA